MNRYFILFSNTHLDFLCVIVYQKKNAPEDAIKLVPYAHLKTQGEIEVERKNNVIVSMVQLNKYIALSLLLARYIRHR